MFASWYYTFSYVYFCTVKSSLKSWNRFSKIPKYFRSVLTFPYGSITAHWKGIKEHKKAWFSNMIFWLAGKSIDNSLSHQYQPLEYESSSAIQPKFLSRGQSYRAVIGDTIMLPCGTQDLGKIDILLFNMITMICWLPTLQLLWI